MKRSLLFISLLLSAPAFAATDSDSLRPATDAEFETAKKEVETAQVEIDACDTRIASLRTKAKDLEAKIASAAGRAELTDSMISLQKELRSTLEACNGAVDERPPLIEKQQRTLLRHGSKHEIVSAGGKYSLRKHEARPVSTTRVAVAAQSGPREAYSAGGSHYPRAQAM